MLTSKRSGRGGSILEEKEGFLRGNSLLIDKPFQDCTATVRLACFEFMENHRGVLGNSTMPMLSEDRKVFRNSVNSMSGTIGAAMLGRGGVGGSVREPFTTAKEVVDATFSKLRDHAKLKYNLELTCPTWPTSVPGGSGSHVTQGVNSIVGGAKSRASKGGKLHIGLRISKPHPRTTPRNKFHQLMPNPSALAGTTKMVTFPMLRKSTTRSGQSKNITFSQLIPEIDKTHNELIHEELRRVALALPPSEVLKHRARFLVPLQPTPREVKLAPKPCAEPRETTRIRRRKSRLLQEIKDIIHDGSSDESMTSGSGRRGQSRRALNGTVATQNNESSAQQHMGEKENSFSAFLRDIDNAGDASDGHARKNPKTQRGDNGTYHNLLKLQGNTHSKGIPSTHLHQNGKKLPSTGSSNGWVGGNTRDGAMVGEATADPCRWSSADAFSVTEREAIAPLTRKPVIPSMTQLSEVVSLRRRRLAMDTDDEAYLRGVGSQVIIDTGSYDNYARTRKDICAGQTFSTNERDRMRALAGSHTQPSLAYQPGHDVH